MACFGKSPRPAHAPAGEPGEEQGGTRVSLRERQKARTREAIRAAAMRLFSEQGYAQTTVEQIAREAEVSHTTFFRYFQTKEQVVLATGLDEQIDAAVASIPPGLGRFDLLREVVGRMYRVHAADDWASDPARVRLIGAEPALREAHQLEKERSIAEAAEFFASYLGVDAGDFGLRVFVAAVGGMVFRLVDDDFESAPDGDDLAAILRGIDLLEAGLPVGG